MNRPQPGSGANLPIQYFTSKYRFRSHLFPFAIPVPRAEIPSKGKQDSAPKSHERYDTDHSYFTHQPFSSPRRGSKRRQIRLRIPADPTEATTSRIAPFLSPVLASTESPSRSLHDHRNTDSSIPPSLRLVNSSSCVNRLTYGCVNYRLKKTRQFLGKLRSRRVKCISSCAVKVFIFILFFCKMPAS